MVSILVFAIMSVFLSPEQFHEEDDDDEDETSSHPPRTFREKMHRASAALTTSISVSFLEFLGGGVDYRVEGRCAGVWCSWKALIALLSHM